MAKKQQGFTLIELMIVIAIIGILAAVALPQYQDFIARSQVTRVVGEVSSLKSAAEAELMRGSYPATAAELGATTSNLQAADPVIAFATTGNGVGTIVATLGNEVSPAVSGATITLTRAATGEWTCAVDGTSAGSWKPKYTPAGCT